MSPLIKLFYDPLHAMSDIAMRAPYFAGTLMALIATILYRELISGSFSRIQMLVARGASGAQVALIIISQSMGSFIPLLFLGAVFVPACLLAASLIDRRASFSVLLRQEYAGLISCVLYSWAAAHLMMTIPAALLFRPSGPNAVAGVLQIVPLPYFVFLVTLALRTVLRLKYGRAVGVVALAACSLLALPLLPRLLFLLSSPFLLILVFFLLRNFLGDVVSAQRSREEFKQNLEAATLNPADASAHYNLGLIYQQRGQYEEAKASFGRAIEIDRDDTDSHYQLGRIAREEGRLAEAISHFDETVRRSPEHSQHEVWREIGRAYFQAGQYEDARAAFERFLNKRPSDAEGRYRYALTLHRLGRSDDAATEMRAVIEAVRTSPAYKYRAEKQWMNEAQAFLRSQVAGG